MKIWVFIAAVAVSTLIYMAVTAEASDLNRAFYILAAAVLTSFLGPLFVKKSNDMAAQVNMRKMLQVDVQSRQGSFEQAANALEASLENSDDDFWEEIHIVVEDAKLHLIDIKAEKWHLDPAIFALAHEYYSLYIATIEHVADLRTPEFKALRKKRKVASYRMLLERWRDIERIGNDILSELSKR